MANERVYTLIECRLCRRGVRPSEAVFDVHLDCYLRTLMKTVVWLQQRVEVLEAKEAQHGQP